MTDNEIIKALECCNKDDCDNCPNDFGNCYANLAGYALDLINRQKAEIERLKEFQNSVYETVDEISNKIKAEAVKKFAERLKERQQTFIGDEYAYKFIYLIEIDNLVKEMVDKNND